MALSRLLLSKPPLHFHNRGIPTSIRRCSSSSPRKGDSEKLFSVEGKNVIEDHKAVADESYVEMHRKLLPEATEARQNDTGSWLGIKRAFTKFMEKMLEKPQFEKQVSRRTAETSYPSAGSAASEVIMTQTRAPVAGSGESKSLLPSLMIAKESHNGEASESMCSQSNLMAENPSKETVDTIASELMKVHRCSDNIKLSEPKRAAEFLKVLHHDEAEDVANPSDIMGVSLRNEKNDSTDPASLAAGINSDEGMVESEEILHDEGLVEAETLEETMFDTLGELDGNQKPDSNNLLSFTQVLLNGASQRNKSENESTSFRSEKCVLKHGTPTSVQTMSSGSEVDEMLSSLDIEMPFSVHSNGGSKIDEMPLSFVSCGGAQADRMPLSFENNGGSETDEMPLSFYSSPKVKGLVSKVEEMKNNQTAVEMAGKASDLLTPNGTSEESIPQTFSAEILMSCIRKLPETPTGPLYTTISNASDQVECEGLINKIQSQNQLQNPAAKSRKILKEYAMRQKASWSKEEPSGGILSNTEAKAIAKNEESGHSSVADNVCVDLESNHPQNPLLAGKAAINQIPVTCFTEELGENKLLIRFVRKDAQESDVVSSLSDCGPILKVQEVSSFKGSFFKDLLVHLKSSEGLQKALKKTDILIKDSIALVEATSPEETAFKTPIPELIGDPDIPVALVKNPTHMIKIMELTREITSHQLKEALSFCESGIASFFLGPSSSTAYVEFEREDAKERALAKHSIDILGKQLPIFRIDAPRTTVVRLQNVESKSYGSVGRICQTYGEFYSIKCRNDGIMDVYFRTSEWPKMLDIVNSLNGLKVDGRRWLAQPAPVFPPPVLQALWSHPHERRYVIAARQSLLRQMENALNTDELTHVAAKLYGHGI